MEKVIDTTKSKLQREKVKTRKGEITIRDKKNGKEARVTLQLNLKGLKNPRIERYGENEAIARSKVESISLKILLELNKLKKRMDEAGPAFDKEREYREFNEYIDRVLKEESSINIDNKKNHLDNTNNIITGNKTQCQYQISPFVFEMIEKKRKQSEQKITKRRKRISPKTVTYYRDTAKSQVLPVFGELDAKNITTEELQEIFDELDYSDSYLKDIKLVLKLSFDVIVKKKIRVDNPVVNVDISGIKKTLGIEIEHLEQDRQDIWLDLFEKDKRQWAYLFECILLTGARPEEACRLEMGCFRF